MSIDIDYIQIEMANPATIASWSTRQLPNGQVVGQILKADTINYRTFKPERGGLFCEQIFGSVITGECACGKTRHLGPIKAFTRPKKLDGATETTGIKKPDKMCLSCHVEPTDAKARRYRMGAICLRKPVAHMWYFRNTPNILSVLLNMSTQEVDETVHFATYTPARRGIINYCLQGGSQWLVNEWYPLHAYFGGKPYVGEPSVPWAPWAKSRFKREFRLQTEEDQGYTPDAGAGETKAQLGWDTNEFEQTEPGGVIKMQKLKEELPPKQWQFPPYPQTIENCGAGAFEYLLRHLDLAFVERVLTLRLTRAIAEQKAQERKKRMRWVTSPWKFQPERELSRSAQRNRGLGTTVKKLAKRLQCIRFLLRKGLRPEWMILHRFPVLPPDLRPMIQTQTGRFATSDLNDLYRRLIYRKIRFEKFCNLFDTDYMPDLLIRHDLCLLQEAADAIIDNGRLEKPAHRPNKTPFKSLTAIIEGKQGRFRQNLLGKRVDYSGRSVIVVGPKLRLHQCGLPREMALELFHPFVIRALLGQSMVKTMRAAKALIQQRDSTVWDILTNVVHTHPILLNRAPTLHRLGIQAFEPILLSGRAIQLHPLVCPAFNADFDGDQMAVHIPLSIEAQVEARLLMLATNNWLSPATGEPSIVPSQDMILGFYYLTARRAINKAAKVPHRQQFQVFQTMESVLQRYALGQLHLHELVWVQWSTPADTDAPTPIEIQLTQTGHSRAIYDSYVLEQAPTTLNHVVTATQAPIADQSPDQLPARQAQVVNTAEDSAESVAVLMPPSSCEQPRQKLRCSDPQKTFFRSSQPLQTIYLRTTPGRLILNHLIYENLFL